MKVLIVNCFDTYENRVDLVYEFFKKQGYDVTVIQSNFRHFKKVYRKEIKKDFVFVESKPYYKNLSGARLSSHYNYAKDAFKIVEDINPELLYVFVPPNSLAKFAARYKQKHKGLKLILDLIDLWPETMPVGKAKFFPLFAHWKAMRDKSLKFADLVITECNLYQSALGDSLKGVKVETVYLAKEELDIISNPQLSKEEIHLAYLGSINNIIDIPKIKEIIQTIQKVKPVTLHIIGDGESKQELIDVSQSCGAIVEYHGRVYDPQEKQDIFDRCHFGLNIMKDSVCVGLTMKSIDYFQHGIPIINNIKGDTTDIVDKYKVGINVSRKNFDVVLSKLKELDMDKLLIMRKNALTLTNDLFSVYAFNRKLSESFEHIIKP